MSLFSFGLGMMGVLIAGYFQGSEMGGEVFTSYFFNFNGVFILGFAFGLFLFVKKTNQQTFNSLFNLLEIPDNHKVSLLRYNRWNTSSKRKILLSIFFGTIGGFIFWKCGYPYFGFSKYFLAVSSFSIFIVAGQLASFFISTILIFRKLDEVSMEVKIKPGSNPYELENLNTYFLICSTLSIITLYLAFRGTLTANFTYTDTDYVFRKLLIYPIICFLPGMLFVSFYYRYVLRKIQENEISKKLETLEKMSKTEIPTLSTVKEKLEMEKLVIEIKEHLNASKSQVPIFSLKDSPALIVSLVLILEFISQNDSTVKNFLSNIF